MLSAWRSVSLTWTLLLLCLLATGCGGQLAKSLVEISRLRGELVKEYGEQGVNVNLNNSTSLIITFINSPLNAKGPQDRARRAGQTAAFVSSRYPSIEKIDDIWVGFVRQETRFIVLHYSESLEFFGFDKKARPLITTPEGLPATTPDNSLRPVAVYSQASNETEVRITNLQLAGDLKQTLSVVPHFTVPGDATGVRRSALSPQSVGFDFASYSEKSLFPGEPKITFLADRKPVFETSAQFSTSKNPDDGVFFESLYLQVPYPAFRRLTTGKEVTIMLGQNEYRLTDEQVQALRAMMGYVRE
jgi:hypothetical protein